MRPQVSINAFIIIIVIVALTGCCSTFSTVTDTVTSADNQNAISDDFEKLKAQYLPTEFAHNNFTMVDAKRVLRQKCKKATGGIDIPNIYEDLEQGAVQLIQCANSIANLTMILEEIEEASPRGDLDIVFQRYCSRRPKAVQCLREFNAKLLPCLTVPERLQNEVMMHMITSLLDFACNRNGDQIALFIAEEGPECLESNKENISNCMNATFSAYLPKEGEPALQEIPELVLGPKQCIDLRDFEECVLNYLEQCNEITPSNVIESLFRFVKNETKCQQEIDRVAEELKAKNPGSLLKLSGVVVMLMSALSLLWAKL